MLKPRVAVIVSHHNRPTLLARALRALAAQTVADRVQVIVCDDASDVVPVVPPDAMLLRGPQLTPEQKQAERCTLGWLINRALRLVEPCVEFIAYLTDDCAWEPDHLERLVGMLDRNPQAAVACSRWRLSGDEHENRNRVPLPYQRASMDGEEVSLLIQGRNFIDHNVLMHRAEYLPRWPEQPRHWPAADWPTWQRLAEATAGRLWLFDQTVSADLYNDATHLGAASLRGEQVADTLRAR